MHKDITCIDERSYWVNIMCKIAQPVLVALSKKQLKIVMPVEGKLPDRRNYTHLEAFGRLMCGIAPWLENSMVDGVEGQIRKKYIALSKLAMDAATNPDSPDYMNFSSGFQPIVDAAFLAHAIVRAPRELYFHMDPYIQKNIVHALRAARTRKPHFNNWLLFSAMIETALFKVGEQWDPMRVDYALNQLDQWYVGDGLYGDGPEFHMDYYNSFVIQPMLVDIVETLEQEAEEWKLMKPRVIERAKRYAVIQERSISPEGTFPVVGRSLAYRFGAFQHLAQMALQHKLDESMQPAQVRCALTAVIKRMIEMPGTFDENGWLRIGFNGHQPGLGEPYISTGSLYLCAAVFLPLGLPESDPFWRGRADWTSKKAWAGVPVPIDISL